MYCKISITISSFEYIVVNNFIKCSVRLEYFAFLEKKKNSFLNKIVITLNKYELAHFLHIEWNKEIRN